VNLKSLTHELTPEPLCAINASIEFVLDQEEVNSEQLLHLIGEREVFISKYLSSLTTVDKKVFSKHEVEINDYLVSLVSELGKKTLVDATTRIRKRKAANKYLE